MDVKIIEIEREVIREIDAKKELKNKIEHLEKVYNTIQTENKQFAKNHEGNRILELSKISGPLFQTIGHFKRELKSFEPEKLHNVLI